MRKQELVHLHGLLAETMQSLVDQGVVPAGVWDEYDALGVHANAVHAPKGDHREAVLLLTTAIRAGLAQSTPEQPGTSAS